MKPCCEICETEVDILECTNCRYCKLLLCYGCEHEHVDNCVYKKDDPRADPELLEKALKKITIPVRKWKGQCYGLALEFLKHKLIKGVPRYGHWTGPVEHGSMFYNTFMRMGWCHHGWVELPNKHVCDPTRWVFEDVEPYIFVGPDREQYYDVGGNKHRAANIRPVPVFDAFHKIIQNPKNKEVDLFVRSFLNNPTTEITFQQGFWIANLPPSMLEPFTKQVYNWIDKIKHPAWIPVDNRRLILKK